MKVSTDISPALYLLPVAISDAPVSHTIPQHNIEIMCGIRHFIVENVRTARRFMKLCCRDIDIDAMTFYELNGHTDPAAVSGYLDALRRGEPVGVMSEAGCPAVADPGADVVAIAQREGLKVVPLVGPSSIIMALMGSGFNGQGFAFVGYLPIVPAERAKRVRDLEASAARTHTTYIFIETPYRNNKLVAFLGDHLRPDTLLCVASDITSETAESIVTRPAAKWRKANYDYDKRPAIFLIHLP